MSDFPFKIKALSLYDRKMVDGYYVGPGQIMSGSMTLPFYPGTMSVFTGKEDVNGKPICTNDIVECTASTNSTESFFTGVCQYDNETGRFMLFNGSVKIGLEDKSFSEKNGAYCYIGYKYRIVGNVCAKKIEFYNKLGK